MFQASRIQNHYICRSSSSPTAEPSGQWKWDKPSIKGPFRLLIRGRSNQPNAKAERDKTHRGNAVAGKRVQVSLLPAPVWLCCSLSRPYWSSTNMHGIFAGIKWATQIYSIWLISWVYIVSTKSEGWPILDDNRVLHTRWHLPEIPPLFKYQTGWRYWILLSLNQWSGLI